MKEEKKFTSDLFVELTNSMIEEANSVGLHTLDAEKIRAIKECAQVVFTELHRY